MEKMSDFIFCRIENYFCPSRKKMTYSINKDNINIFLNKLKNIHNVIYYNIKDNKLSVIVYNYFFYFNPDIESRKKEIKRLSEYKEITVLFNEKIFKAN